MVSLNRFQILACLHLSADISLHDLLLLQSLVQLLYLCIWIIAGQLVRLQALIRIKVLKFLRQFVQCVQPWIRVQQVRLRRNLWNWAQMQQPALGSRLNTVFILLNWAFDVGLFTSRRFRAATLGGCAALMLVAIVVLFGISDRERVIAIDTDLLRRLRPLNESRDFVLGSCFVMRLTLAVFTARLLVNSYYFLRLGWSVVLLWVLYFILHEGSIGLQLLLFGQEDVLKSFVVLFKFEFIAATEFSLVLQKFVLALVFFQLEFLLSFLVHFPLVLLELQTELTFFGAWWAKTDVLGSWGWRNFSDWVGPVSKQSCTLLR